MRVLLPALYGRVPVLNLLIRCLAELDAFVAQSDHPPVVYFVDDNFIGDRQATRKPLPRLVEWQRQHSHPLQFACEATLHKATQTDILGLMRQAGFLIVFVGIERGTRHFSSIYRGFASADFDDQCSAGVTKNTSLGSTGP